MKFNLISLLTTNQMSFQDFVQTKQLALVKGSRIW